MLRHKVRWVWLLVLAAGAMSGCVQQQTTRVQFAADEQTEPNVVAAYGVLLQRYVESGGAVRLTELAADAEAQRVLEGVVARACLRAAQAGSAEWLNAANAAGLRLILEFWPIERLRELPANYFEGIEFNCGGQVWTLRELHQRAGIGQDWRRAAALGAATLGGPPIATEPYATERLDGQLDEAVARYIGSCAGMRMDYARWRVLVGEVIWQRRLELMDAYQRRYGVRPQRLLTAITPLANPKTQRLLANLVGFDTAGLEWSDLVHAPGCDELAGRHEVEKLGCGR